MRTTFSVAAAGLVLAACTGFPLTPAVSVEGRGDPAADVAAVQRAVDAGGTVLLKGRFDFGPSGSVSITRDVAIVGETDAAGKPVTLIQGGRMTLRSEPPKGQLVPGPKITIKSVRFDGATGMPIRIGYASGGTISGNVITRVQPILYPPEPPRDTPFFKQRGILVGTVHDPGERPAVYLPDVVTGRFEIVGNDIDLVNEDPKNTLGQGVFVYRTTGIDVEVAHNKVRNVSRNGIEVIENVQDSRGGGRVVIRDNEVETPLDGITVPGPGTPNGIVFGYTVEPAAGADSARRIPHAVSRNRVVLHGRARYSVAIVAAADGAVVDANEVFTDATNGIGISVFGPNGAIRNNRFGGSGAAAIYVVPAFKEMTASNNEVADNDFGSLQASGAHVSLAKGSRANRVSGSNGTCVDQGEANVIQGLERVRR